MYGFTSYGFDWLLQGELIRGLNSWISYSYLDSREKDIGSSTGYQRRLFDQRHTLRIFLQDKIPKHPNYQLHVRLIYGSGFLYHPRKIVDDISLDQQILTIDWEHRIPYSPHQLSRFFMTDSSIFSTSSLMVARSSS